jgi:hypothetical protein
VSAADRRERNLKRRAVGVTYDCALHVALEQLAADAATAREWSMEAQVDLTAAKTLVMRGLCERARNAGGRDLERVALAEGRECAADLGAALVIDAVGVVDEHSQHPCGTIRTSTIDRGQEAPSTRSTSSAIASCAAQPYVSVLLAGRLTGPHKRRVGETTFPVHTPDCGRERTPVR